MTPGRRSLSRRLTSSVAITILMVVALVSVAMDRLVDAELKGRFRDGLRSEAQGLAAAASMAGGVLTDTRPRTLLGGRDVSFELQCAGRPVSSSTPRPHYPTGWPAGATATPKFSRIDEGSTEAITSTFHTPGNVACTLLVTQSRRELDAILVAIDWILFAGPALATLLVLVLVPLLVRRGLAPLRALRDRMDTIGPQVADQRLGATQVAELDPLVVRFNEVLARMDDGLARERQFASGLAHETRTRLAELRSLVDVESHYPSGRSLGGILVEVGMIGRELEATVTALLHLTRLEGGLEPMRHEPLDLPSWLRRIVALRQPAIAARQLDMRVSAGGTAVYDTDPALLDVLVGNLLDNAVSYSPVGARVEVRQWDDTLEIVNATDDLEPGDLSQLGHRFWRKRSHEAGHAGLGLALAHAAARQLGARLTFTLDEAGCLHARCRLRPAGDDMPSAVTGSVIERDARAPCRRSGTPAR
jgi:signal transduction histidine kinase